MREKMVEVSATSGVSWRWHHFHSCSPLSLASHHLINFTGHTGLLEAECVFSTIPMSHRSLITTLVVSIASLLMGYCFVQGGATPVKHTGCHAGLGVCAGIRRRERVTE